MFREGQHPAASTNTVLQPSALSAGLLTDNYAFFSIHCSVFCPQTNSVQPQTRCTVCIRTNSAVCPWRNGVFYFLPNSDSPQTNNAYLQKNLFPQTSNAYPQSKSAHPQTNSAYSQTVYIYPQVNSAYPQTVYIYPQVNSAYPQTNIAYPQTNCASPQANGTIYSCIDVVYGYLHIEHTSLRWKRTLYLRPSS